MLTRRSRSARKAGSPPRSRPRSASSSRSVAVVPLVIAAQSTRRGGLLSCRDRAPGRDPPARGTERLPARAGGQDRGRRRPAPDVVRPARSRRHALVRLGAAVPARDWPEPIAALVAWVRRLRVDHGEGRAGLASIARPTRATGSSPSRGRRGARPASTEAALALAERDVSPSRTAQLTGAQERLSTRWRERIAAARHDAADVDPRRRPARADRLDQRHERQEHGHPADHPHPAPRRAARRDDDLGRRPRRRADGRARRLDRAGRRAADPGPARHRGRACSRRPAAGSCCAGVGYESNDASRPDQRLVRPPRPAGHPHAARAGRGQGHDLPDHEAGRLGRPQRRRPARGGGRAAGPRDVAFFSLERDGQGPPRRPPPPRRRRPGATSSATAGSSRSTGDARTRSSRSARSRSRSAGWPGTTSRMRWRPPAARAASGASIEQVRDGLRDFRPSSERSPGRLNIFRLGAQLVIVDFAHNEAGIAAVLDVAEGDRRRGRRPGRADHGDHRHGRRPAGRHAARHRPDRRPAGAARRDQGDAQVPARPDGASVVGELLAGVRAGGGVAGRRADLRVRDRGAPGRAQRATARRRTPPRVIVLMCHEEREEGLRAAVRARRPAGRRGRRADRARARLQERPRRRLRFGLRASTSPPLDATSHR